MQEVPAWVNSLRCEDDMVLLAPTVTALHTLLEEYRAYAGPHDIIYNTPKQYVNAGLIEAITGPVLNNGQARK